MRSLSAVVSIALLAGCKDDLAYEGAFEQPSATAVLQPEMGGPFEEPVGYVANGQGGQIVPLALKQGRFLTDDPTASFLRGAPLGTGESRRLVSVAAWTPGDARVDVLVGDAHFGQLVQVRHITGVDDAGAPIEPEARAGEPVFLDEDGSGDSPTLADVSVKSGYTTSESWSISFDGERWWVVGSRSGRQELPAETGRAYSADQRRLNFTIEGSATVGDRFEITTEVVTADGDPGIVEHDVGGIPLAIASAPDGSRVAMVVHDRATDAPVLRWFDPAAGALVDGPVLPDGASPERIAWSPEGILFVADLTGSAWEITADDAVIEHGLPWPVFDVAPLTGDARLLYLARLDETEIWILDLDTGLFTDVNTWIPGVQGQQMRSPVSGIDAVPVEWRRPQADEAGIHPYGRGVGVSLAIGRMLFLEEGTGCVVSDDLGGPRSERNQDYAVTDYDTAPASWSISSGAFLEENGLGGRHIQVNPCGGIASPETWVARFDRVRQGWVVEGAVTGVQATLAREDERYISDDGAISFTIRSGTQPSEDGWAFQFNVLEGVLTAEGDNDRDGSREVPLDMPTDPVFFWFPVGVQDGAWDPVDTRPFLLVASQSNDRVGRVEPSTGDIEVDWQ